jgi:hypothetical protein
MQMHDMVEDIDGLVYRYIGRPDGSPAPPVFPAPSSHQPEPEPEAETGAEPEPEAGTEASPMPRIQAVHAASRSEPDEQTAQLLQLVEATKTADGRAAAVQAGGAAHCARLLAGSRAAALGDVAAIEQLTLLLRCLRNMCVGSRATQEWVWESGATAHALELALAISTPPASGSASLGARATLRHAKALACAAMAMQFIGNSTAAHAGNAKSAWALLFPHGFTR